MNLSPMTDLIVYIRTHGIAAQQDGEMIRVETVYCRGGIAFTEAEYLEPNIAAVRAYLGY